MDLSFLMYLVVLLFLHSSPFMSNGHPLTSICQLVCLFFLFFKNFNYRLIPVFHKINRGRQQLCLRMLLPGSRFCSADVHPSYVAITLKYIDWSPAIYYTCAGIGAVTCRPPSLPLTPLLRCHRLVSHALA